MNYLSLYGAWPLVPSKVHPGELTIQCPFCKSTDIALTVEPGPIGTGPEGRWRMGDPGGRELALCSRCKKKGYLVITTKFSLGRVVITPEAQALLDDVGARRKGLLLGNTLLERHAAGDWGDVDAEDKRSNDNAVTAGERLHSSYELEPNVDIWIITEADRSVTTILLPSNY